MKEKIDFKKSIIFKSTISEITDINVTHDYSVKDDTVEGEFHLTGLYKMTAASVKEEEFFYNIPFVIALSDRIKKESINLQLFDFNYEIQKDTLNLKIVLNMEYEENEKVVIDQTIDELLGDDIIENPETPKEEMVENIVSEEKNITEEDIEGLTTSLNIKNDYVTYKVHITRQDDTMESIASKYNITIDDIKEYNEIENISIGDKIVIPFIKHD